MTIGSGFLKLQKIKKRTNFLTWYSGNKQLWYSSRKIYVQTVEMNNLQCICSGQLKHLSGPHLPNYRSSAFARKFRTSGPDKWKQQISRFFSTRRNSDLWNRNKQMFQHQFICSFVTAFASVSVLLLRLCEHLSPGA